jgi:hypothetical protein
MYNGRDGGLEAENTKYVVLLKTDKINARRKEWT